jgi:hypothetical protein
LRQIHAALQAKYQSDHLEAGKVPPHAFLTHDLTYMAAYKKATAAAVPDKGERPDRDPHVCGGLPALPARHRRTRRAPARPVWVLH